jgi:hypothetical protein
MRRNKERDMLRARDRQFRRLLSLFSAITVLLPACGTINPNYVMPDICKQFDDTKLAPLAAPDPNDPTYPKVVFETPGQIKVMHGFGRAQNPGTFLVKLEQRVSVPAYATRATVFLNGWHLVYPNDHHVMAVGALITKIKHDPRTQTLTWIAAGMLRDDDLSAADHFTYYYTVIAWNDTALNLSVDHGNADNFCNPDTDLPDKSFLAFNRGTSTALSAFSVFAQNPALPPSKPVAILPRGFGFVWYDSDHHLLQLGYNLDYSEIFAEHGKTYNNNKNHVHTAGDLFTGIPAPLPGPGSRVDSGFVTWNTFAIFKDDATRRDYLFSEMVSTLGGTDVGLIQPPFAILPKKGEAAGTQAGGVSTQDLVIENVPFEFAIPMLTGWELAYLTDDQHAKEVGIWIDDWSYTAGSPGGTLRYRLSSILRDNDTNPPHYARHKVTVIGIRAVPQQPVVPRQQR